MVLVEVVVVLVGEVGAGQFDFSGGVTNYDNYSGYDSLSSMVEWEHMLVR